jgi:hypothetical protein
VLPLNRSLTLMITYLLADRRSAVIWFSPVQGLHTRLGCFKFAKYSFFKIGCLYSILQLSESKSRSHRLTMRVARWKVEHLTEGEVLRCAASFFRFHDLCTSEDRDADLLLCMCKPPYDTDLLSHRS